MTYKQKHFFCFQFPGVERPPIKDYNSHAGKLITTLAVSSEQAANNAIYSTFHPIAEDQFKLVTKYLHEIYSNISNLVLDIDELDTPVTQLGLFGGQTSSYQRRDEGRLTKKIAKIFTSSLKGENSPPRIIAREYINYRRAHPLNQNNY